jgi:hypothetical protein
MNASIKYVLMTGAPGSRWSGVSNNIWIAPDFDHTDSTPERKYTHNNGLVHGGAYFDPMMEFDFDPSNWDLPFSGEGVRLIKSHTLSTQLQNFHKYPIILVYRNDYECWKWWNECGGFDITYPNYAWYKNQENMFDQIQRQNQAMMQFIYKNENKVTQCDNNLEVLKLLDLTWKLDPSVMTDEYSKKDVKVYVYRP